MTGAEPVRPNPYVGPRAFQRGEALYGRDREVLELLDLLIAERIVLLYSPSGAGKTSLVQAALIPELEAEGFQVLPPVRVRLEPPETRRPANRYVLSALLSLEEGLPAEAQTPLEELAGLTLSDYLERRAAVPAEGASSEGTGSAGVVLVFDQFEEVLTVDPTDREAKAEFFAEVGEALRDWGRWALFAMREEFVAGLDPYLRPVPTRLGTRYRLELLGEGAAQLAVQEPARGAGVEFTGSAAVKLVDDLRRVWVQRPDGTAEEQLGPYVEPVQLQVVCRRLWEELPADDVEIDEADVTAVGNVDTALRGYYGGQVAAVAAATGVRERAIRNWFDRQLITDLGIRGQVLQGPERSEGLDNRAIWPLVDAHLVRAEQRRGATWFELAHDRLIEPVRGDNAAWRDQHLSALQRQAALWENQGRSSGLLLREQALLEAETWAAAHDDELTEVERAFLADCQEARAIEERERRQAQRIRRLAVGATIFGLVAILLAVAAGLQWRRAETAVVTAEVERERAVHAAETAEAERQRADYARGTAVAEGLRADQEREHAVHAAETAEAERQRAEEQSLIAQSRQVAAMARSELDRGNAERALLLAIGAYRTAATAESENMLYQALNAWQGRALMGDHKDRVSGAAISPDGQLAVTLSDDTVYLWELGGEHRVLTLTGHEGPLIGMGITKSGEYVVTLGRDQTARLWRVETGEELWRVEFEAPMVAMTLSPDGQMVAFGGEDARISVRALETGAELGILEPKGGGIPYQIAFSPDSQSLAAAYTDGLGHIWRGRRDVLLEGHSGSVETIAFSPDGQRVVTLDENGTVRLWDPRTGEQLRETQDFERPTGALVFSPDSRFIAIPCWNGSIYLWDLYEPDKRTAVFVGHTAPVASVSWSPDGYTFLTSSWDTTARLWDLGTRRTRVVFSGHEDMVWSASFSPDGESLITASKDRTARLWSVRQAGEVAMRRHADIGKLVAFGQDSSILSVHEGMVYIWKPDDDEEAALPIAAGGLQAAALSADGSLLATADEGGQVRVWTLAEGGAEPAVQVGNGAAVRALAFDPDGRYVALGGRDGNVRVVDAETGTEQVALPGHQNDVYAAAFGPDSQFLATGSGDGTVRLWDWQQGAVRYVLETGRAPVWAVAFSTDGQYLAAADEDSKIWVWNLAQDALLERSLRNESRVRALAFSPAGDRLVAGAEDGAAYLWDWRARDVRQLRGHWGWIESVAFHADGQYLATTGHDGTVRLWPASPAATISLACSRVSRDLGPEEWAQYVGEVDYPPLCPEAAQPPWVEADRLPPPGEPIAERLAEEPPSPPTVFYFEAVPGTNVRRGESVLLRWDLIGATGVYLHTGETDVGGQGVAAPGEITVTPDQTTVYRLRAINEDGETVKVVRIVVREEP